MNKKLKKQNLIILNKSVLFFFIINIPFGSDDEIESLVGSIRPDDPEL